jgi:hypothetical protein
MQLGESLQRSLLSTNAIENTRRHWRRSTHGVNRWRREGDMATRWLASGLLWAQQGFHRVRGHEQMNRLIKALSEEGEGKGAFGARVLHQHETKRKSSHLRHDGINESADIPKISRAHFSVELCNMIHLTPSPTILGASMLIPFAHSEGMIQRTLAYPPTFARQSLYASTFVMNH